TRGLPRSRRPKRGHIDSLNRRRKDAAYPLTEAGSFSRHIVTAGSDLEPFEPLLGIKLAASAPEVPMSEDNPNIAAPESTGRDPNQAEEFVPGPLDDASR